MGVALLLVGFGLVTYVHAQGCSRPEGGPNMYLTGSDTFPVEQGAQATFKCNIGYSAEGASGAVTCDKGTWTPLRMRCIRKNCGSAGEVINGVINYNEGTEFGDKITITCNTGYRLVGRNEITCGDQGWLDRLPTCEVITAQGCSRPEGGPNMFLTGSDTFPVEQGAKVTFKCNIGYSPEGTSGAVTCDKGTWSPLRMRCTMITAQNCPRPEGGPNMYFVGSNTFPVADGTTATFSCETGYKAQGDVTCNNGAWSSPRMRCTRKNCGSAGEVANGVINYNEGTEFGDRITITCNTGYRLFGRNKITCGDQGWLDRLPTCEAIV